MGENTRREVRGGEGSYKGHKGEERGERMGEENEGYWGVEVVTLPTLPPFLIDYNKIISYRSFASI